MKTLCMDSSHKHLVIILIEDNVIKGQIEEFCWKKQSESLFPALISLMESCAWTVDDLDQIVITDGPGSYTGVRIAMSVAKVLSTRKNIPLYCISSLQLLAGVHKKAFAMMDARSNRAYCAFYENGKLVGDEMILTIDQVKDILKDYDGELVGDCSLVDKSDTYSGLTIHFKDLLPLANKVKNVHALTPRYLKEQEEYKAV